MTTELLTLLEQLRHTYISHQCNVDQYLQPGLSKEEILTKTSHFPFDIPPDFIELYTWRNGQSEDAYWQQDAFFFRDNPFISLEQAVKDYTEIQNSYGPYHSMKLDGFDLSHSIPIAAFEGAWYVMVCGEHKLRSKASYPIVNVFEGLEIYFFSLESMLKTCIAWIEDPHWSVEERLSFQPEVELDIWKKHNPNMFK